MQAVILAAGKGTRLFPLATPKPLTKIAGKTIIEHTLSQLEGIGEVVVVTGYGGEEIRTYLESIKNHYPFTITAVEQPVQKGTFDALHAAKSLLQQRFLLLNGDDLYQKEDIKKCIRQKLCILTAERENPQNFGVIEEENGFLKKINEKPENPKTNLVNTGLFVLDKSICEMKVEFSKRGELELTDAINMFASQNKIKIEKASSHIPIGYPWDILAANEQFLASLKGSNRGTVEKNVTLNNAVSVGKGTVIRSGAYIEGPVVIGENCVIGPNCFIRPSTSIGNSCKIGNGVEIKNSVIGDHVAVCHLSYIGDSVIGSHANIGGGTIAANWRHDNEVIESKVNGKLVNTKRRKFGCVIGEGVHTGIHTSIYPGRKISTHTLPGEVVKDDK